jgi:hypothetical protein
VATQKSKRSSRKRARRGAAPRAVASTRREERVQRQVAADRDLRRARRQLGREGERPRGFFGGVPVSEIAILAGLVGAVIGYIRSAEPVIIVGVVVCAVGVVEICGREHFSGYRSHTILLSAVPAVAIASALVAIFGVPGQRAVVVAIAAALYALLFWPLKRSFSAARRARVARQARSPAR